MEILSVARQIISYRIEVLSYALVFALFFLIVALRWRRILRRREAESAKFMDQLNRYAGPKANPPSVIHLRDKSR